MLEVSYPRASGTGQNRPRRPSRFLAALNPALFETASAPTRKRRDSRRRVANCRICDKALVTGPEKSLGRCRTCVGDLDEELYARLQQWRKDTVAKLSKDRNAALPAYLVATDATLQAIAEQKPATLQALAEIPGIGPRYIDDYGEALLDIVLTGDGD